MKRDIFSEAIDALDIAEPLVDEEDPEVEDGDREEECGCINPKFCAAYLVGRCDGRNAQVSRPPRYDSRTELSGNLKFGASYDPEFFDD